MTTKVYRIVVCIIDHEDVGAESSARMIVDARYPARCISPHVLDVEERQVEWSDEHPLNHASTSKEAWRLLFERESGDP